MEAVNAKHSAVRVRLLQQGAQPEVRVPRTRSRSSGDSAFRRLNEAFHRYADDVPEDSFPTFLESLYLDSAFETDAIT